MARSSAMRFVTMLARIHAQAWRSGDDPTEFYKLSRERSASRRDVLAGAGALGFGAATRAMPARASQQQSIAIVGAGMAGMAAALRLADQGLTATIYEASDRVGGRMHSEKSYWSYNSYAPVSEYCGELIDTDHKLIRRLAKRFKLRLTDLSAAEPSASTETYYLQAAPNSTIYDYYPVAQAIQDFAPVYAAVSSDANATGGSVLWNSYNSYGLMLDRMSVYDWISSRVPGGFVSPIGRLLNSAYEQEYGALTTDQSALNLVLTLSSQPVDGAFSIYGVSDQRFHIEGGNDQLPLTIASYLRFQNFPPVRTGHVLRRISQSNAGVTLDFDVNGATETVSANLVILTIPFSVLRNLDTSQAGFDQRKITAINRLGAGQNAKLVLQYTKRLWNGNGVWGVSNGDVYTDLGFRYFTGGKKYQDDGPQAAWDTTRGQAGPYGLITNYTGGDAAASFTPSAPYLDATDAAVRGYAKGFARAFDRIFPGSNDLWNGRAILSTPFRDPNLLLSYSYWRVGQYTSFAGYEGVRQNRIFFAGEHCSVNFQGFMEGAAEEGWRAAGDVASAAGS